MNRLNFGTLFPGLLPLFVLAHLAHHLTTALTIPLLPFIRDEFALDYTRAGLVTSAFSISYGISQVPAGWLADRIGARILLTISIIGVAVAALVVGVSQTYIMLVIGLLLMGILGGGYHPTSPTLISAVVEPRRRGWALGVHMIGGSVSYFLSPLIAAAIAAVWSWRGSFITMAIPSIAFGIAFYLILARRAIAGRAELKTTGVTTETPSVPGARRRLIAVIILSAVTQSVLISVITFLPLFLVDQFGTGKEVAAAAISLVYACGLWAGPLGGHLSDRWGRMFIILTACFLAVPAIYLLNLAPSGLGISAVLVFIGTIMYINTSAAQAYVVDQTTERNRSTILGIFFFGTMEGSGILTPTVGYLIDNLGFAHTFTISAAIMLVLTLGCSLLLRGSRK